MTLVAGLAEPSSARTIRFRNETTSKLVAYRPGIATAEADAVPIEVDDASLEPATAGRVPEPRPESAYYSPADERGIAFGVAEKETADGEKFETLSVRRFTGPEPWPATDSGPAPVEWRLAPGLPTVVTLTEDWEVLVRPVVPTSIVVRPSTVSGGYPVKAEVSFSSPSTGTPVMLESSNPDVASVPGEAATEGGRLSFVVTTSNVDDEQDVEISVVTAGVRESAMLTVQKRVVQVVAVTFNRRNLIGGEPVVGTVHVEGMTKDTEPVTVLLRPQDEYTSMPDSIAVAYAPRISRASFNIETKPVTHLRKGGVNAVIAGGEEQWAGFTLTPLAPVSFSASRASAAPGDSFDGMLKFRVTPKVPASVILTATPDGVVEIPSEVALEPGATEIILPIAVRSDIDTELPVTVTVKATMKILPELAQELRIEVTR